MYIQTNENHHLTAIFFIGGPTEGENIFYVESIPELIAESPLGKFCYNPNTNEFYENPDYIEPDLPTSTISMEAQKQAKIKQIKTWCADNITNGFTTEIPQKGILHYTLTQNQQDDMKVLYLSLQNGADCVLWHDSTRVMHEPYTAEQFTAMYNAATAHVLTCKLHSDGLEQYAVNLANEPSEDNVNTLNAIEWNTELPTDIQEVVETQLQMMLGGVS